MIRPMVDHVAQRELRLAEMIERMGVDPSRLRRGSHGEAFALASWNCVRCSHPTACSEWIDSLAAGPVVPPHFCPNCDLLKSYIIQP